MTDYIIMSFGSQRDTETMVREIEDLKSVIDKRRLEQTPTVREIRFFNVSIADKDYKTMDEYLGQFCDDERYFESESYFGRAVKWGVKILNKFCGKNEVILNRKLPQKMRSHQFMKHHLIYCIARKADEMETKELEKKERDPEIENKYF